jgi:trehalose synthase
MMHRVISRSASIASLLCLVIGTLSANGHAQTASRLPADEENYVRWLEERSILAEAQGQAVHVSGNSAQWRHPYGNPRPREAVKQASVWLLDYPGSVIPRPGKSVIETWADPELWQTLDTIGIKLLHTGPLKRAGGLEGRQYTPSVDGWFDPISLTIDPELGSDEQYSALVKVAARHKGLIAGDLIPLHTGRGPDFRLAQLAYRDYPGLYTMVEIAESDWDLLPEVTDRWSAEVVSKEQAVRLHHKGYLPGLINSNDASPKARELSGWSATGEIVGVDGRKRRWVFLHYFKKEQPALNWMDPSFAAQRAIAGDIVKSVHRQGTRVLRLDAVPFLGIEPQPDDDLTVHFKHPLSVQGTNSIAFLIRKLGGFSFQELNIPLQELKTFTEHGPDLSYDFVTRAQCVHALLTQDAAPLRQAFQFLMDADIQPLSLVHDLQNHDEITYQLVELDARGEEVFELNGQEITGRQLRDRLLSEMRDLALSERGKGSRLYRSERDGLATTFTGFVAAALEVVDPDHASEEEKALIQQGHLLLAMANAMQPGVFSLSSWDLMGALPIPEDSVADRMQDGDYRWINRGGVDLMGANPAAKESAAGIERAVALYGPLPKQLEDPDSFVSQLRRLLEAREKYEIAEAELIAVPEPNHAGVCLLVLRLPNTSVAVTAMNFSRQDVEERLNLGNVGDLDKADWSPSAVDILSNHRLEKSPNGMDSIVIDLPALTARTLVFDRPIRDENQ